LRYVVRKVVSVEKEKTFLGLPKRIKNEKEE